MNPMDWGGAGVVGEGVKGSIAGCGARSIRLTCVWCVCVCVGGD
jgi:hypothetical protein